MKRIYISGRMKGLTDDQINKSFDRGAMHIISLGLTPMDPRTVKINKENPTYEDYMSENLKLLLHCDGIYMLTGWEDAKGARLELEVAKMTGINVEYETAE